VALFFVSPLQINFQVPFLQVSGATQTTLTITQGQLSNTFWNHAWFRFAPALFTTNSQGTGQAAALIGSSTSLAAPKRRVPWIASCKEGRSSRDILYRPRQCQQYARTPGFPAQSAPFVAHANSNPQSVWAKNPRPLLFSGLSPGFVGLYQVNVQIPSTSPSGSAVPLVLKIGGVTSNTATIAVQVVVQERELFQYSYPGH